MSERTGEALMQGKALTDGTGCGTHVTRSCLRPDQPDRARVPLHRDVRRVVSTLICVTAQAGARLVGATRPAARRWLRKPPLCARRGAKPWKHDAVYQEHEQRARESRCAESARLGPRAPTMGRGCTRALWRSGTCSPPGLTRGGARTRGSRRHGPSQGRYARALRFPFGAVRRSTADRDRRRSSARRSPARPWRSSA
jgi:hypothetical protein